MPKKNNEFFLEREYRKSWNFLKNIQRYIYFSMFVFLFSFFVGFFVPFPEEISQKIFEILNTLLLKTEGLETFGLIKFIFLNNLQSSFMVFVFGIFFGILPFFSSMFNGILLGFVASLSMGLEGILSLWKIFPHGIFELPAVFISLGMGLKLGLWLIISPIKFYWKKNKFVSIFFILFYPLTLLLALFLDYNFQNNMKKDFGNLQKDIPNSFRVFLFIVIPLLLIASIIEGSLISFFR